MRNILYRYLSALEEGLEAIANRYCGKLDSIKKLSKSIHKSITQGSSLSKELEDLDFNRLMNLTKKTNC